MILALWLETVIIAKRIIIINLRISKTSSLMGPL